RPRKATEKRELVRSPAGGNPADGNDIGIAGETGIANVDIIADDAWVGTGVNAYRGDVNATGVVSQRKRAYSRIVAARIVVHHCVCSNSSVLYAAGVEYKRHGSHGDVSIFVIKN